MHLYILFAISPKQKTLNDLSNVKKVVPLYP